MGTPQMRWREMHQSGRVAIMLEMRSSPQAGSQTTCLISSRARWRKVVTVPSSVVIGRLHADEPLLGGADDDGVVAAPAVRVGVLEAGGAEQSAAFAEQLDDAGVGFEDGEVFVGLGRHRLGCTGVALAAGVVDVLDLWEAVALAGVEVVDAVGGRGVDGAGALVGGDVVGGDAEDAAVEERMLEGGVLELAAGEERDDVGLGCGFAVVLAAHEAAVDDDGREERLGDDIGGVRAVASATYSRCGLKATACDAGSVHGVVVQMMV